MENVGKISRCDHLCMGQDEVKTDSVTKPGSMITTTYDCSKIGSCFDVLKNFFSRDYLYSESETIKPKYLK